MPQYPQGMRQASPTTACFPLAPWTGFAVECVCGPWPLGLDHILLRQEGAED